MWGKRGEGQVWCVLAREAVCISQGEVRQGRARAAAAAAACYARGNAAVGGHGGLQVGNVARHCVGLLCLIHARAVLAVLFQGRAQAALLRDKARGAKALRRLGVVANGSSAQPGLVRKGLEGAGEHGLAHCWAARKVARIRCSKGGKGAAPARKMEGHC